MKPLDPPSTVFDRWHIDHLQLCKAQGFNYVLVFVDFLSLWSVLFPSKSTAGEETARLFYDNLFMVYGCRPLVSDRGASFRSRLVRSLCSLLGVKHVYPSSRHPQSNFCCKAYNRNLLNSLRFRCGSEENWPALLPTIGHAFRTSFVKQLGASSFKVLFGQKARLPVDKLLLPLKSLPASAQNYYKQLEPQLRILQETFKPNKI